MQSNIETSYKKYVKMAYNGGGEQASISYRIALKLQ